MWYPERERKLDKGLKERSPKNQKEKIAKISIGDRKYL